MNNKPFHFVWTAERLLWLLAQVLAADAAVAATLRPLDVAAFAVTPDEPSVLRWKVEGGDLAGPIDYTIRDYWDNPAALGQAQPTPQGTVETTVSLKRGFYEVDLPVVKQRFGVLSLPAFGGERDRFFAIDSALSWLVRDDQVRAGLIAVLARSGAGMSRERLAWGAVNPKNGSWDWETSARYDTVRRVCAEHGVEVLEMLHDAPAWPGKVGKYPENLVATAQSWQRIAEKWRPTWGAMEVWNEPDIFFGANLPADQYVPLVKTLAWSFASGKIDCPIVGGVMAHFNRTFLDTAARNGMLDCVDVVSFHTYGRAPEMEALVRSYCDWLRAFEREAMPLWITECGRPWARGPARPPVDQDAVSALDITMKGVEARACGIARYFPFVYPYFEENDKNFGMMGRCGTPLRSMAAYARMVSLLAHKRYLGDLKLGDDGAAGGPAGPPAPIVRARVFGDERETIAVLYTGRPDAKASVRLDLPATRIEGIDGRPLVAAADGAIAIPDGLVYLWLDREKLGDRLQSDTPAMRLWTVHQQPPPRRPAPSPIVLRYQIDPAIVAAKSDGYRLAAQSPGKTPVRVRVYNLSDQAHEINLAIVVSPRSAQPVSEPNRPVTVPALGFADAAWEVDISGVTAPGGRREVQVTATGSTAGTVAPLVVTLE